MSTCIQLDKEKSEFLGMLSVGCAVLSLCGRVFVGKGKVTDSFVGSLMKKE